MKEKISTKQLREFGLLIGFGFPILIGWFLPSITGHGFRAWTLWIGCSGSILGLIAPSLLEYPYRGWMKLGHLLGWVNSRIILALVFILVLLPIAGVMRLFGHDPLKRRKNGEKTYREIIKNRKINLTRIF
tara:strand:+ start:132 stop:524 length:393 start_codon:yes stop_codon:yes gene_type:complete